MIVLGDALQRAIIRRIAWQVADHNVGEDAVRIVYCTGNCHRPAVWQLERGSLCSRQSRLRSVAVDAVAASYAL